MVKEGLDVFQEFDIKDKAPISIYTNGPVDLAMETTAPLIGIADRYAIHPALDIGLTNREGWEGEITDLKELVLFFPEGITLKDCNKEFVPYTEDNCKGTCTAVEDECDDICRVFEGCGNSCEESKTKCDDTCTSLLVEGNYKGYSLNLEKLELKGGKKDPEKFKLFRCRFQPDANIVLGNAPIATKFFRVKARYNYKIEEDVSVKITDPSVAPPTNLVVVLEPRPGPDAIALTWDKSEDDGRGVDDVTGYKIYRRKSVGGVIIEEFREIKEMSKDTDHWADGPPLEELATYGYKVEVVDDAGNKAYSNEADVKYAP
jgi:hypothetical protein